MNENRQLEWIKGDRTGELRLIERDGATILQEANIFLQIDIDGAIIEKRIDWSDVPRNSG